MQDIHHIGSGGGDRRMRPHNHQALKCPRCDSLNTKFCYYNNYNLSQPRHFCKCCRRYWTKGGVLRNVPVGGGCRKAKRSKQNGNASSDGDGVKELSSNVQSSSSDSSSLTAGTTTATTPTSTTASAAEEGSAPSTTPSNSTVIFKFSDARFVNANPSFNINPLPIVNQSTDGQIFATESFASLITSPAYMMAFGVTDIPTTSYERAQQQSQPPAVPDNPAPEIVSHQTAAVEGFNMQEMNDEGLTAALAWGSGGGAEDGGDQGLFDLTAAVHPAYWNQTQWTDSDNQSLNYLP